MIAACPKCAARYRVEREKLGAGGVRLRCAKCESVFRVRAPDAPPAAQDRTQIQLDAPPAEQPARASSPAPQPAPAAPSAPASGDLVLVAIPEADVAKQLADALAARGVRTVVAHDGVEAVLELQRQLPKAAVVAAHLPKMFGFQICELVKRNESLRGTWLVLAGAIGARAGTTPSAAEASTQRGAETTQLVRQSPRRGALAVIAVAALAACLALTGSLLVSDAGIYASRLVSVQLWLMAPTLIYFLAGTWLYWGEQV